VSQREEQTVKLQEGLQAAERFAPDKLPAVLGTYQANLNIA
jgi:hypothetical protein